MARDAGRAAGAERIYAELAERGPEDQRQGVAARARALRDSAAGGLQALRGQGLALPNPDALNALRRR